MNYTQPDWDAINLEKRKQIAWNSAINNTTQLYASGIIQDMADFHTKILEYYDLILNMPLEGSKMPVDESYILSMCERTYKGETYTVDEYERLTDIGKKIVNVVKKSMKTTDRWKDKANGDAPPTYKKAKVIDNQVS